MLMLTRCIHACGRHVHPLDPRALGDERGAAFYLRAMGPAVVRLVFCPSAQAAQGLHRGSRVCCQRGFAAEQAEATPESAPRYRNSQLRVKRIHGFMSVRPDYFRTAQCIECNAK